MTVEADAPLSRPPLAPPLARAPLRKGRGDIGPRPDPVARAVARAARFLWDQQRDDGHWCAEIETNASITAEYVMLTQVLGVGPATAAEPLVAWLWRQQRGDGGWSLAPQLPGDLSTTAEVYLALRLLGVPRQAAGMRRAAALVRAHGGLARVRVFTRVHLAMFGLMPWTAVPSLPPEIMLVPKTAPLNIYRLASWARGTMVPLMVVWAHRPRFALPAGHDERLLDDLWLEPGDKNVPYAPTPQAALAAAPASWGAWFTLVDRLLARGEQHVPRWLRRRALDRCVAWILERQEPSGDWAGIFPPMCNNLIALKLEGFDLAHPVMRRGLTALERFAWQDEDGWRMQACVSPVWDTVLSAVALADGGQTRQRQRDLGRAAAWLTARQQRTDHGDWRVYRPRLAAGGWSFEYTNSWYPDVDDTAAVLLALFKQDPGAAAGEPAARALTWMLGMQNRDGGWAAFDVDNDRACLNEIPFSDMDSLCDPSTPDVAGRVVEALGLWQRLAAPLAVGRGALAARVARGLRQGRRYLAGSQSEEGCWFGRWGVNTLYGTSNVLCGLAACGVGGDSREVRLGLGFVLARQNGDGGWGEELASYHDRRRWGRGPSTASQTAWALLALVAYLPPDHPAIVAGGAYLVARQVRCPARPARAGGTPVPAAGGWSWEEPEATGTGFPGHFYLRYHLYRHYFPLMALGRIDQARRARLGRRGRL